MGKKAFFIWLSAFLLWIMSWACNEEKEQGLATPVSNSQAEAQENTENSAAEQTKEEGDIFQGPSCQELEIPSWERRIRRLSDDLCVRCHNASFAWNGARLDSYDEFVRNSANAIERIRTRDLTITINVLEAAAFMDWYEAGMPETEESCATSTSQNP
ncbi:MAG: hypothetical protein ACOH5I_00150 [Oligoflexus sp.]